MMCGGGVNNHFRLSYPSTSDEVCKEQDEVQRLKEAMAAGEFVSVELVNDRGGGVYNYHFPFYLTNDQSRIGVNVWENNRAVAQTFNFEKRSDGMWHVYQV